MAKMVGMNGQQSFLCLISKYVSFHLCSATLPSNYVHLLFIFHSFRDFATSNLIEGKGLKGKCWPELDMLQFEWLTDPS